VDAGKSLAGTLPPPVSGRGCQLPKIKKEAETLRYLKMLKSYFPKGVPEDFFMFDPLYEEGSRISGVPVPLYRTIASRETGNDPTLVNSRTHATGLLQLLPVTWREWNNKVAIPRGDAPMDGQKLLEPQANVGVGSWLMTKILDMFRTHPNIKINWRSIAFVELFVFAYHAGMYGADAAIKIVEASGLPVTLDNVIAASKQNLAATFPYARKEPAMLDRIASYDKVTAILYDKTRNLRAPPRIAQIESSRPRTSSGAGALGAGMLATVFGVAVFGSKRK
jgi:hypothetical protein